MSEEKTVYIEKDNEDFFITYDDEVAWITDLEDASHPETIAIYIADIPKLIRALRRTMKGATD